MADVDQYYRVLDLEPGASWDQVKRSYRELAYVWHPDRYPDDLPLLKQKAEDKLKAINIAYDQLRSSIQYASASGIATAHKDNGHSRSQPSPRAQSHDVQNPDSDPSHWQRARLGEESAIQIVIRRELACQEIEAEVAFRLGSLQVSVNASRYSEPAVVARILTTILNQIRIHHIQRVTLKGLSASGNLVWSKLLMLPALPRQQRSFWFAFDHLEINALAFPLALVCAALISQISPVRGVPWQTWVHDLGQFSLTWLASRTFWADTQLQHSVPSPSLLLYGVTLLLLMRWGWWARRKRRFWLLTIVSGLILTQFWLTFLISETNYALLVTWVGSGGELILGTVMMIGFHFRLPFWWRWRLWRYPVLLVGTCTYWQGFERWHGLGAYWGLDWSFLLAGRALANQEIERLVLGYGWHPYQIVTALAHLGELCGLMLLGVYVYSLSRSRGVRWHSALRYRGKQQRLLHRLGIRLRR